MARAVIASRSGRRDRHEPLYEIDRQTGDTIEVFYADHVLAASFSAPGTGWFWWTCQSGQLPDTPPCGPFATSYTAYRDAMAGLTLLPQRARTAVLAEREHSGPAQLRRE